MDIQVQLDALVEERDKQAEQAITLSDSLRAINEKINDLQAAVKVADKTNEDKYMAIDKPDDFIKKAVE